ncbi:ornithine aminotransferase [Trichinella spiralis]|uniref:ornithine aminotransferase n=1 Tax=Trichinella spiralis TaxID=6334 RepID=UPI0001EFC897|nr:ornithine aminotransferase [Trichinella spiralis]
MTNLFGYDKLLPINSGVEGCESAMKLARRWAYDAKQILGKIISRCLIKHGLGMLLWVWYFMPDFKVIPYDDPAALEKVLNTNGNNVAAFMVEPIQGEAGVRAAEDGGYLRKVAEVCPRYNVLLIVDEVQTGLGRTGKWLCSYYENVHNDILILDKTVLCGCYLILTPDQKSSTFGGNLLACRITMVAVIVVDEENLASNAFKME